MGCHCPKPRHEQQPSILTYTYSLAALTLIICSIAFSVWLALLPGIVFAAIAVKQGREFIRQQKRS